MSELKSYSFDFLHVVGDYDGDDELSEGEESIITELTTKKKNTKCSFAAKEQLQTDHPDDDDGDDDGDNNYDDEASLSDGEEDIIDGLTSAAAAMNSSFVVTGEKEEEDSSDGDEESTIFLENAPKVTKPLDHCSCCLGSGVNPVTMPLEIQKDEEAKFDTATTRTTTDSTKTAKATSSPSPPFVAFVPGDHVYQWHKFAGIPVYQHHGIVMKVYWDDTEESWMLHISDFSNISLREAVHGRNSGGVSGSGGGSSELSNPFKNKVPGAWRSYVSPVKGWIKVVYKATFWQQVKNPSAGTSTATECDPSDVVIARVLFLQEYSASLLDMPYHWAHNNCETAAVWCKTGSWCTLQVAGTAATTQLTAAPAVASLIPLKVLAVAQPYMIPIVAVYGVVTIGVPAVVMHRTKSKWNESTIRLNDAFMKTLMEIENTNQDEFVSRVNKFYRHHPSKKNRQIDGAIVDDSNKGSRLETVEHRDQ